MKSINWHNKLSFRALIHEMHIIHSRCVNCVAAALAIQSQCMGRAQPFALRWRTQSIWLRPSCPHSRNSRIFFSCFLGWRTRNASRLSACGAQRTRLRRSHRLKPDYQASLPSQTCLTQRTECEQQSGLVIRRRWIRFSLSTQTCYLHSAYFLFSLCVCERNLCFSLFHCTLCVCFDLSACDVQRALTYLYRRWIVGVVYCVEHSIRIIRAHYNSKEFLIRKKHCWCD